MRFGRIRPAFWAATMTEDEVTALANYNAECKRGLVHTPECDALMAQRQRRFDDAAGYYRDVDRHPLDISDS